MEITSSKMKPAASLSCDSSVSQSTYVRHGLIRGKELAESHPTPYAMLYGIGLFGSPFGWGQTTVLDFAGLNLRRVKHAESGEKRVKGRESRVAVDLCIWRKWPTWSPNRCRKSRESSGVVCPCRLPQSTRSG